MSVFSPVTGQLNIDRAARTVTLHGRAVALSPREFAILEALLERPGVPVSRMALRERLYGANEPRIVGNPVQVHIHNLRTKLGEEVIETLRGAGYVVRARWLAPAPASLAAAAGAAATLGSAS